MNVSEQEFVQALDRGIDDWLASRGLATLKVPPLDLALGEPLDASARAEIYDLVSLLELVAAHSGASDVETEVGDDGSGPHDGAGERQRLRDAIAPARPDLQLHVEVRPQDALEVTTRRAAWPLRAAAVIFLVLALTVGLTLAAVHRPAGTSRPTQGGAQMPAAMLTAMKDEADYSADPYPQQPLLWVKTTLGRVRSVSGGEYPLDRTLPDSALVWETEMRGSFYGDPAEKSSIFHEYWGFYVPASPSPIVGVTGPLGNGWGALSDLSRLGAVHSLQLVAPPAQPLLRSLPPSIAATLEADARANHEPYPAAPALWVETTAGTFRHVLGADAAKDFTLTATAPAGTPVWIVDYAAGFRQGNPRAVDSPLWVLALGVAGAAQHSWLGNPPGLSQLSGLPNRKRFGQVYEAWIAPSLQPALSPLVADAVASDLEQRYSTTSYLNVPRRVDGTWTETTVAALESFSRPQVEDGFAGIPGNTPVWAIVLSGLSPTRYASGRFDWVIVTTTRPGSSTVVPWTALGASPLFGITRLSQIGAVHDVTFHVTAEGTRVTFTTS
ncbi:MAG: hypothetical protein ABSB54_10465 [Acidimicrobiales bacterium]|jgi:hypothetical protein